ncbi:MAG: phospholipase D family protein [Lutibacter sp.]|jgi:phosphatidylserine/phosphatidylglycerophosphate/cardiolipin synthase-like enzyme
MKSLVKLILLILPIICEANPIDVCFTPQENCTSKIVTEINNAKKEVLVQAYSFTSIPIIISLLDANKKSVNVKILLDKSQKTAKYSSTTYLIANNIWYKIDYKPAIAHNKIIIIDNETVITGSFNFTKAAQFKNTENVLIIHDKELAKKYKLNWIEREKLSK